MTFDLRDNIRAEQAKLGMLPDGNPTAAFLEKLGVKAAVINVRRFGRVAGLTLSASRRTISSR